MPSKPFKDSEIARVLPLLPTLRDRALFMLGVKTGFRISELLSLSVKDVWDGANIRDTVTVKRANMKGKNNARTVPMHKDAKRLLKEYICTLKEVDVLFPIGRYHTWRTIKIATRLAGLSGQFSTHSMRKSFGMSVYTRSGNNLKAAQLALGHKSIASTGHYLSVESDTIAELILTS